MGGAEYFTSDGKFIYLKAPHVEFYIPQEFFKSTSKAKFAEDRGETIRVIGVFDIGIFDEKGNLKEMRIFKIPSWIELFSYDNEVRDVRLPKSDVDIPCRVLSYYEGAKIMSSTIIEDSDNAQAYLKLICAGKVPSSVPYSQSAQIWKKNQLMNGVHLGVPAVIEELILSVSYRSKDNLSLKFAQVIGQDDSTATDYDYKMASIRQICQFASTFSALLFEDFDSMAVSSLNRTRMKKPEAESPLEKIIKM